MAVRTYIVTLIFCSGRKKELLLEATSAAQAKHMGLQEDGDIRDVEVEPL